MMALPCVAFFFGIAFMLQQGYSSKRKYFLEQAQLEERAKAAQKQQSETPSPRGTISPAAA